MATFKKIKIEEIECMRCVECGEYGVDYGHTCNPLFLFDAQEKKRLSMISILEKNFPRERLVEEMRKIFAERIHFYESKLEEQFGEYDALFLKGLSFKERCEKIDVKKIEWLRSKIESLKKESKSFKIRPFSEWIYYHDFYTLKKTGFKPFLRLWFNLAYYCE